MPLSDLGDLVITVGGDLSPLNDALNQIPVVAQQAASGMDAAFQSLGNSIAPVEHATKGVEDSLKGVGNAANEVKAPLSELGNVSQSAGLSFSSMTGAVVAGVGAVEIAIGIFESFKAALERVVEEYGMVERAAGSLAAITGATNQQATAAIAGFENLANSLGFVDDAFISMSRDLAILGIPLADMGRDMQILADASVALGTPIGALEQKIGNMAESGILAARNLSSMRLSLQDVGAAMGMVDAPAKVIQDSFKGIEDSATKADVLFKALSIKFPGYAAKMANDTTGSWNQIKNAVADTFKDIGKQVDGFKDVAIVFGYVIKGIETIAIGVIGVFKQLANVIGSTIMIVVQGLSGLGKVVLDVAAGNIKQAGKDITATGQEITKQWDAFLNYSVNSFKSTSTAIENVWSNTTGNVAKATEIILPPIAKVTTALDKLNDSFAQSAQKALDAFAKVATGEVTAESALSKLNAVVEAGSLKWDKLSASSADALQKAMGAAAQLKDIIAQAGLDKLNDDIAALFNKFPKQIGELDISVLNFINTLKTLDTSLYDAPGLKAFLASLKQAIETQKALDDSTRQLEKSTLAGGKAVADFGVNFVKTFEPAVENAKLLNAAIITTGIEAGYTGRMITGTISQMNSLGLETQQQFEAQIKSLQTILANMQLMHQPLMMQLNVLNDIYAKEVQMNQAVGASGLATLKLVEDWQAVRNATTAANDETMLLANTYQGFIKSFSQAWNDLSRGIADAIVSGQNFGQVMGQVLDTLEKQLSELIVNYLMTQLKDALLADGELLKGFNSLFGSIFGATGSVVKGIGAMDRTIATSAANIEKTGQAAAESITKTSQAAGAGMTQLASTMMTTLLPAITAVASVIGAISGIIANFQLAHINTALGRIEESTRKTWIVTGETSDSIVQTSKTSSLTLGSIEQILWNPISVLLTDIASKLDTIGGDIHEIMMNGGGVGGGSGGGNGSIAQALSDLTAEVMTLNVGLTGPYGLGIAAQGAVGNLNGLANTSSTLSYDFSTLSDSSTSLISSVANLASTTATAAGQMMTVSDALLGSQVAAAALTIAPPGSHVGGITPINTNIPSIGTGGFGGPGGSHVGGLLRTADEAGPTVVVNITAGVVAGNDGIGQLADMVGGAVVNKLQTVAGLRVR